MTKFGDELRRLLAQRGISLSAAAREAGCSKGYLSNAANGRKALTPRVAAGLDQLFGTGGTFAAYALSPPTDSNGTESACTQDAADPVNDGEGDLLSHAPEGVLAGGRTTSPSQPDPPRSADRDYQENAEDVVHVLGRIQKLSKNINPDIIGRLHDDLSQTIADYEKLDHAYLAPALQRQRAWIDVLLDECSHPRQRQELFEIAGGTSGVLGYVMVGRGDFPLARAYCLEAFQLGDLAQDATLQAWARGLQSFCEYYAGRYDEALRLAEDGLTYAQSGPQSVRLAVNGAARALGKLGDTDGVHRAVGAAYDLMSHNDVPDGVPSSIAFDCYSAAQTASNAATAYVSLGLREKVQHYIGLAMPDISNSGSPWSRSLVMIDLALSLIRPGQADLDRAAGLVLDALGISAGRPVISVQQRTSEFVHDATGRWGSTQQVRMVRDAASALTAH